MSSGQGLQYTPSPPAAAMLSSVGATAGAAGPHRVPSASSQSSIMQACPMSFPEGASMFHSTPCFMMKGLPAKDTRCKSTHGTAPLVSACSRMPFLWP